MNMKKIIVDSNIPLTENFNSFGKVIKIPGREWNPDLLRDADILLTRSVTKVNADLLKHSCVKFVGTATSGFDHVDLEYLDQQGISFSYCPGSNANSVGEYVLSALFAVTKRVITKPGQTFKGMTAGIIGCGHVGSQVEEKLKAIGIECILNDPPLGDQTGDEKYRSLEEALSADIVTLHTPLTTEGRYPTNGLLGEDELQQMKPDVILINAARGGVVDEKALLHRIEKYPRLQTVIDCWENEPFINKNLLRKVSLGTPHIAGYSYDGKVKATKMLYHSVCDFLKKEPDWQEDTGSEEKLIDRGGVSSWPESLYRLVFSAYDIRADNAAMKVLAGVTDRETGVAFDGLRKNYPVRQEFENYSVRIADIIKTSESTLKQLGFQVVS